jgi:hypothetical protein
MRTVGPNPRRQPRSLGQQPRSDSNLCVPLGLHWDDAGVFGAQKMLVLTWGSVAKELLTLDGRLLFSVVSYAHMVPALVFRCSHGAGEDLCVKFDLLGKGMLAIGGSLGPAFLCHTPPRPVFQSLETAMFVRALERVVGVSQGLMWLATTCDVGGHSLVEPVGATSLDFEVKPQSRRRQGPSIESIRDFVMGLLSLVSSWANPLALTLNVDRP